MALCLVLLFSSGSNAQVDPTTGNLINTGTAPTGTTTTWNNGVYVNQICFQAGQPGNCGPNPSVRASSGDINFSYGQVDLNQIININRALAAGGTGVQLSGFNFGFRAKNGNGWDDGRQDYLDAYVKFYNAGGGLAATYDYVSQTNKKYDWTNFHFSETFASPIAATNYSNAQVGFIGKDNNFWTGNYGPEIQNVSFNLSYKVDPCSTNPAYSTTCAGFNKVTTTSNLLSPNDFAGSYNQAIAINTALTNAGVGAMVHGFNYGFSYTVGQSWSGCTATNQDGSCSWYMDIPASARVTATINDASTHTLAQKVYSYNGDNTNATVVDRLLLSSSLNQTSLSTFRLNGSSMGTGSSVGNFWANMMYTADPCSKDPLYSSSCNGYAYALAAKYSPANSISTSPNTVMVTTPESTNSSTPTTNVGGVQMSSTGTISAPDNIPQALKDVQAISQQAQDSQSNKSSPNMSLIMSVLNQVQANDKATQAAAVQNAQQVVATSASKAQEQANQIVESLNAMSQASSQASMLPINNTSQSTMLVSQQNTSVVQLQAPTATNQMSFISPIQSITLAPQQQVLGQVTFGSATMIASVLPPQVPATKYEPQKIDTSSMTAMVAPQYEQPKFENNQQEAETTTTPINTATNYGANMNDLFASKINFESLQTTQTTDGVKKNVTPNDLAGNVDIASIATTPKGYEAYSFVLKDAAFYKSEAIYKDQKTVDNARAFRSLSSDRLHQEMVDQQYKGR